MNENAVLYAKLAAVMSQLKRLKKKGFNQHFKYKFVSDADVLDTLRKLLAEKNIAVFASMTGFEQVDGGKTSSGGQQVKTRAHFEFTLACGDSGATVTSSWYAESLDTSDKGLNKAATAALKYWLLKTFLLSTGDEADDPDAHDLESGATTKNKPATSLGAGNTERRIPPKTAASTPPPANGNNPFSKLDGEFNTAYKKISDVFAQVRNLYPNPEHMVNSINALAREGGLNTGMTVDEVVAAVKAHKAAAAK
jgi:hypothetical protein